jgi:tRNA(Ile)-lysidine synthase
MSKHALSASCLKLVAAVEAGLTQSAEKGQLVRVACSGGPDSLALAAAVAVCSGRDSRIRAEALVVDHQLQDDSAQVAERAVRQVEALGLPARSVKVTVPTSPDGPEAAARGVRYGALRAADSDGQRPDLVLLGHTTDDQAETVLLGLLRGSGTRSLAGMPESFGGRPRMWRPFLGLRRADTEQACADWGLEPWHDPHNSQERFTRSRIRHNVMPVLAGELGPAVVESLARTAELAREDADLLDRLAREALVDVAIELPDAVALECVGLAAQPDALQGRIVRQWLVGSGVQAPDFERTRAILELVRQWHGQKAIDLAGGRHIERRAGQLRISQ